MSITFTLNTYKKPLVVIGRLAGHIPDLRLRDFQIKAMEAISLNITSRPYAHAGFSSLRLHRHLPCFIIPRSWHNPAEAVHFSIEPEHAPLSKFNKRLRNKFLGVDKPEQVVNSNKYTKKKTKRKSK